MAETLLKTVAVPNVTSDGGNNNEPGPANLAYDPNRWLRVLVRNISVGIDVTLALDSSDLRQIPMGQNTFLLPAGVSEVIPLAPAQKLYAACAGNGALVSVAISDALPADIGPTK